MINGTYFKNASVTAINDISASDGAFIVSDGSKWVGESEATARTSIGLGTANSPTFTGLDLTGITDNYIPYISTSGFASSPLSIYNNNIGINNVAAGYPLHVYGAEVTGGNEYGVFGLIDTTAQAAGVGGSIALGGKYSDAGDYTVWAFIRSEKANSSSGNYAADLVFGTRAQGSSPSEKMKLTSSGSLGVGDSDPTSKLDVTGDINTTEAYKVDDVQVISNRVIDSRISDTPNSGDATTDGLIDAIRDAMITHGLIAAS